MLTSESRGFRLFSQIASRESHSYIPLARDGLLCYVRPLFYQIQVHVCRSNSLYAFRSSIKCPLFSQPLRIDFRRTDLGIRRDGIDALLIKTAMELVAESIIGEQVASLRLRGAVGHGLRRCLVVETPHAPPCHHCVTRRRPFCIRPSCQPNAHDPPLPQQQNSCLRLNPPRPCNDYSNFSNI